MISAHVEGIVRDNSSRIAKRYKRKCWWVDEADLRQEASLQQLRALPNFDSSRGRPLVGYLWRVAVYAARNAVLKASAPVSASHDLSVLKGLQRAPITDTVPVPSFAVSAYSAYSAGQIREQVVRCLGQQGAEFAFAVLVEGWGTAEIAQANGVSESDVLHVVRNTRGMLARDERLQQFWKEMT